MINSFALRIKKLLLFAIVVVFTSFYIIACEKYIENDPLLEIPSILTGKHKIYLGNRADLLVKELQLTKWSPNNLPYSGGGTGYVGKYKVDEHREYNIWIIEDNNQITYLELTYYYTENETVYIDSLINSLSKKFKVNLEYSVTLLCSKYTDVKLNAKMNLFLTESKCPSNSLSFTFE